MSGDSTKGDDGYKPYPYPEEGSCDFCSNENAHYYHEDGRLMCSGCAAMRTNMIRLTFTEEEKAELDNWGPQR